MRPALRRAALSASCGIAAALLVAASSSATLFRAVDARAHATLLRTLERPFDPQVALVALDTDSYQRLSLPLPLTDEARLIEAISAAGAKAIGFDYLLSRPGPGSPADVARLADAFRHTGAVFPVVFSNQAPARAQAADRTLEVDPYPIGATPAQEGAWIAPPLGPLAGAAAPVSVLCARAGPIAQRGLLAFVDVRGRRLPTMALRMLQRGLGLSPTDVAQTAEGFRLGGRRALVDADGEVLVNGYDPATIDTVSFAEALGSLPADGPPRLRPELAARLRGKYVFVSRTTPLMHDYGRSVTGEPMPLVLMHASLLSDLLEHRTLRQTRPAESSALLLAFGVVCALLASRARPLVAGAVMDTLLVALWPAAIGLARAGVLIPIAAPIAAALAAFAVTLGVRLLTEQKERRILLDAFGAYVDRRHLQRVLDAPEQHLALGGARREVTLLFADVQGYTALSNQLTGEEVIGILREYLAEVAEPISENGGRIDKIMGDGIMAVFGDPLPDPAHAKAAITAALGMHRALAGLNARWSREGRPPLSIRIGLATGEAFVGNIGSEAKIEYTAIGPVVNLASRLEGKAPAGGILVSALTAAAAGDAFRFEKVEGLALKGFEQGYTAYRVVAEGAPVTVD